MIGSSTIKSLWTTMSQYITRCNHAKKEIRLLVFFPRGVSNKQYTCMLLIEGSLTWKLFFHVFLPQLQGNLFLSAPREERELLRTESLSLGTVSKGYSLQTAYRLPQQSHRDWGSSLGSRRVESLITRLSFTVRTGEQWMSLVFLWKTVPKRERKRARAFFILRKWHVFKIVTC